MHPSAGPGADPHPVPVRGAGVVRHGLFGTEEVHPQRLGSQVGGRFSRYISYCFKEKGVVSVKQYFDWYVDLFR